MAKYVYLFKEGDATKLPLPCDQGIIVCNPPYGERLSDRKTCQKLYHDMKLLKDRLRLKEQQLRERDEWRQHLHRMSGGWVMHTMLVIAYIAAVTTSCYDTKAFYTAFGLLVVAALLKLVAEIGYGKGWFKV